MKIDFSPEFYETFIETIGHEVDRLTDQILADEEYPPFFRFLDGITAIEEKIENMVKRGYLPEDIGERAKDELVKYVALEKDFPEHIWKRRTEE